MQIEKERVQMISTCSKMLTTDGLGEGHTGVVGTTFSFTTNLSVRDYLQITFLKPYDLIISLNY